MTCFYPMQGLRTTVLTKNGKNKVVFLKRGTEHLFKDDSRLVTGLSCGQCTGCRLERSRQWAIRLMHESSLYTDNCFITLTFNDESLNNLVKRGVDNPMSLHKPEFQKFMKRFRKFLDPLGIKIRYYMCGEYGERFRRPHYHAIVFGYDFPDKKLEKVKDGFRYYSSKILSDLWSFGTHLITDVTFDSCAYVARYIMKKQLGKDAWKFYYDYFDEMTGELVGHRVPEYTTMSRRSGIGRGWIDKHLLDVYQKRARDSDRVFMRGRGFSMPPKYYDTVYEVLDPSGFTSIKEARVKAASDRSSDNTPDRLAVKQAVKLAQISTLKRTLE